MGALRFLDVGDKVEVVIERVSNSGNGIAPCPSRWCSTGELLVEGDVESGETVTVKLTEDGSVAKATPIDPRSLPDEVTVDSAVEFYEGVQKVKEERQAAEEEAAEESLSRPVASQDSETDREERLVQELRAERLAQQRANKDDSDDGEENLNELLKGNM